MSLVLDFLVLVVLLGRRTLLFSALYRDQEEGLEKGGLWLFGHAPSCVVSLIASAYITGGDVHTEQVHR